MANATFSVPCPAGVWTPLAAGVAYATVQLQKTSVGNVQAAIATTEPAPASTEFVLLSEILATFTLAAGDVLWCMPLGAADAMVRGIGTGV
ncbi:hypothetical protein [Mesorhizobium sp. M7A.F.Ca.MR.148.00.0.0]|uniref:hypothetical protein n=1 Tax=Mesorhizobium sp. M7A.F.Ca.MR.148.00.0.0 TaxID=2496775 RepID=UPI000FCA6B7A|nr:hypothetical protein [Mesorhizobium sp. M7A.F.Ca.MR.148.00.0.0]RUV37414.1 hypothetical protein EOB49_11650 [Mesorhizobium sp. M7A.F.Ca.MR.148.00.0.0]